MLLIFLELYFYESFLQRGNLKFPTWIAKHLDTLQTVTYMTKNYIFCDRKNKSNNLFALFSFVKGRTDD